MWWQVLTKAAVDYHSNSNQRKQNKKTMDVLEKQAIAQNNATINETARQIGEINRQRTITNIQTSQALLHYQKQGLSASATNRMMVAQSGVKGTGEIALESEIQRQKDEANAMEYMNLETQHLNFNNDVMGLVNGAKGMFKDIGFVADSWKGIIDRELQTHAETANMAASFGMNSKGANYDNKETGRLTNQTSQVVQTNTNRANTMLGNAGYTGASRVNTFKWTK